MMNCFVARHSSPDGLLKFDLLCWSMTSFSDNLFFMIIYLYYRGTQGLLRWPGLYCAVRHYPNMHEEKSPYSEEFIIYIAGVFQRVEWNGGLSFLMLIGSFVEDVLITPVLHKLWYQYPAWISLASTLAKRIVIKKILTKAFLTQNVKIFESLSLPVTAWQRQRLNN